MAEEKGMKKPNPRQAFVYLPDEINQRLFDAWDIDFDGHLSIDEVSLKNKQDEGCISVQNS